MYMTLRLLNSRKRISSKKKGRGRFLFRFVSFSDVHFGIMDDVVAPGAGLGIKTEEDRIALIAENLINEKENKNMAFFIGNGDIVHNSSTRWDGPGTMLRHVMESYLDEVGTPYYLTAGNHDIIANNDWIDIVGKPRSNAFEFGDFGFILLDSSDADGARQVCVDKEFLDNKLHDFRDKKSVFFVSHIPRYKGGFHDRPDADSPNCDPIMESLVNAGNVHLMTSGHFHYHNERDLQTDLPLFFSGHASNYGVPYYCYRTFDVYDNKVITREWNMFDEKYEDEYVVDF